MLSEEQILNVLDNYRNGYDSNFVDLGHPYVFPIDSRVNLFRNNQDQWAIAIEVFEYNTRQEGVALNISYFGNCLQNLQKRDNYYSNSYHAFPVDIDQMNETVNGEKIKPESSQWIVRGKELKLSHNKKDYEKAGILLKEYTPDTIRIEEAARLLVTQYPDLFRATDEELYKSIPQTLQKIMVIDEWHHRDFVSDTMPDNTTPVISINKLKEVFQSKEFHNEIQDFFGSQELQDTLNLSAEEISGSGKEQERRQKDTGKKYERNSRPGSYETWQLVAKVLVTGNPSLYKPTLPPTSHWKNWPEAGSM
jgi:hypothetical protein